MKKAAYNIFADTEKILRDMGEQIMLARLRRNLTAEFVSERADIRRATLSKAESGNPACAIGNYEEYFMILITWTKTYCS